jgi:hypothetical protein
MIHSKAVADSFLEITWKSRIKDFFWPIVRNYRRICRSLAWAKLGWNNYDWDHAYLLEVIEFKLKRMQREIVVQGHHIPDKATDQSLRLAIKLVGKLQKHDYGYFCDQHIAKWGSLEFIEKTDENGRKYTGMGRPGVTPEQEEAERAEFRAAYLKDDSIKARDTRWLFNIIAKYNEYWWD